MNPPSPSSLSIRTLPPGAPMDWLIAGWRDFLHCPKPGLAHGFALAAFGAVLWGLFGQRFWLIAGATSGFLIVAPILATGMYAISRALHEGRNPTLADVLAIWRSGDGRLVRFGLLLALAGTGWVLTSAAAVTGWSPVPIQTPADFMRHIVLNRGHWWFEAWLVLGGLLAAPMFASSVIAIPLMLDRPVSVREAVTLSWQAVLVNPITLGVWAGMILTLTLLGIGTGMLGLIVIVPVLGHASWHAYRGLVRADDEPARPGPRA